MFDRIRTLRCLLLLGLLVVLCGESEVHPVINTGTLYN